MNEWKILSDELPSTTSRIGFTICYYKNEIFLFGGDENFSQFPIFFCYSFKIDTKEWTNYSIFHQDSPEGRHSHSGEIWKNNYIIFGGDANTLDYNFDEIWIFNFENKKWNELTLNCIGSIPTCRSYHTCNINPKLSILYIFGGILNSNQNEIHLDDLYSLTLEDGLMWKKIENKIKPSKRRSHSSILSKNKNSFFIFGGFGGNKKNEKNFLNDLWNFNFENEIWNEIKLKNDLILPNPRRYFSISFDINENGFFIFGGYSNKFKVENDLWKLEFNNFEKKFQTLMLKQKNYQDIFISF